MLDPTDLYNKALAQLNYDPDTGVFTRKLSLNTRYKVGQVAGSINASGHRQIKIDGVLYSAHRLAWLIMTGEFPAEQIDHINQNPDDNRWCNLREVSDYDNRLNRSRRVDNRSGCTGVLWHKKTGKWAAQINFQKKNVWLGVFDDFFEACCVRKSAEREYGFHENHGSEKC